MGRFTFRLPDIGEGIAEAEIVAWHVKLGDRVEEDAPLADVMTDKATVEMESPVSGVVVEMAGEAGDTIAIGSPLVVIETEGDDASADLAEPEPAAAPPPVAASAAPPPPMPAAAPAATRNAPAGKALYTFRLPDIGEGIAEAEIVAWHVAVGDHVEEDQRIADVMTDKATVEMESPVAGVVRELAGDAGQTIAIGSPLLVIETEGGELAAGAQIDAETPDARQAERVIAASSAAQPSQPAAAPPPPAPSPQAPPPPAPPLPAPPLPATAPVAASGPAAKVLASPAVRARAAGLGIDLGQVKPGQGGIIRHADLDAFLVARAPAATAPVAAAAAPIDAAKRPVEELAGAGEKIKVIGLRRRIAENMAASKRNIPHFSYVDESDVTALEALRAQMNAERSDQPKLTVLPFLIAAICRCLPEFPMLNARYDDDAGVVTRYDSVHLGVATQTPAGLMVPVIRDAQTLGLGQLASEISRLADAARNGTAKPEELSGSTLTLTSLGPLGGVATTPVINRPEVAIIGPNRIIERPVFVSDGAGGERLEKRKLMNISISCDHRVVDGWDAASFVQALKRRIENPLTVLA